MLHLRHARKRKKHVIAKKIKEPSLHIVLDKVILVAAVIAPLTTLPQIYDVWVLKKVEGVSLLTWSSYLFFSVIWLAYGLVHKDKPIIIANALWIVVHSLVVIAIT